MVLMNSASRSRNVGSLITQNQGGGSKKAGFPYQIGREYRSSIALKSTNPAFGRCCKLSDLRTLAFTASISRPIGRNYNVPYWSIPGVQG